MKRPLRKKGIKLLMMALMIIDQASRLSHIQRVGDKDLSKCPQRKFEKRAKGDRIRILEIVLDVKSYTSLL